MVALIIVGAVCLSVGVFAGMLLMALATIADRVPPQHYETDDEWRHS